MWKNENDQLNFVFSAWNEQLRSVEMHHSVYWAIIVQKQKKIVQINDSVAKAPILESYPANIYLFKINNRNTRKSVL